MDPHHNRLDQILTERCLRLRGHLDRRVSFDGPLSRLRRLGRSFPALSASAKSNRSTSETESDPVGAIPSSTTRSSGSLPNDQSSIPAASSSETTSSSETIAGSPVSGSAVRSADSASTKKGSTPLSGQLVELVGVAGGRLRRDRVLNLFIDGRPAVCQVSAKVHRLPAGCGRLLRLRGRIQEGEISPVAVIQRDLVSQILLVWRTGVDTLDIEKGWIPMASRSRSSPV